MSEPVSTSQQTVVGLHHVALTVCDVAAAERFYSEGAGYQPWPQAHALGLPNGARALCTANAGLWLLPAAAGAALVRRPVNEAGIAHLCLQTPDIGLVIGRFKTLGASLHSEPIDLGTGFLYCYARDPEANVIEVEGVAPVWTETRPWLAHANIVSHDLTRLTDFYSRWLGIEAVRSPRLRDDVRISTIADLPDVQLRAAWLNLGNAQIEIMQYLQPATGIETGRREAGTPGFAHLGFEVRDLAAAGAHLQACGGRLDAAPATGAWQAMGHDPDGNRLLLLDLHASVHQGLRIADLADAQITQRFTAARAALLTPQ